MQGLCLCMLASTRAAEHVTCLFMWIPAGGVPLASLLTTFCDADCQSAQVCCMGQRHPLAGSHGSALLWGPHACHWLEQSLATDQSA